MPVEYKKGNAGAIESDKLQLTAQAMCLEEMLCCEIPEGYLYYGEPRRRTVVPLDAAAREDVLAALAEMRSLYQRRHTPKVKPGWACRGCSLAEICLPKLKKQSSALQYLQSHIREEK